MGTLACFPSCGNGGGILVVILGRHNHGAAQRGTATLTENGVYAGKVSWIVYGFLK